MLNKKIIQELSKKHKLPEHIIETIVRHPYKFQLDLMKDNSYRPFRHPYFGVFAVKPYRLKVMMEKNAKKS